ncbi:hypothetical protein KY362_08430 [Candidatus Woesearchaeota archaeon]|nr:hypothetical protein [Candidatus Woesearchaeota archaeon]
MKKRGGSRGAASARKNAHTTKRATTHSVTHAAKRAAKHASHARPKDSIATESNKLLKAAGAVLEKEERKQKAALRKEVRFLISPHERYVVSFVFSLMILAILFYSASLIFYAVLTVGALSFVHFLKKHRHKHHDILAIIWIFFLPIAVTISLFRDGLAWLILAVYIASAISTAALYYYHKKEHRPLKIMWQVTYSKIVALTITIALACLLPSIALTDSFLSFFELAFAFLLPLAIVFFFLTKFLYLYFFDWKHIKADALKSLRHSLIFSLAFLVIVLCGYSILAVSFHNAHMQTYSKNLQGSLLEITQIRLITEKSPAAEYPVAQDLITFSQNVYDEVSGEKAKADEARISLAAIADESYFRVLMDSLYNMLRFAILKMQLVEVKAGIIDAKDYIDALNTIPEGADIIAWQTAWMTNYVDQNYVSYNANPDVQTMKAIINNPDATVSDYENNGLFYMFAKQTGTDLLYDAESIFGRQASKAIRHTAIMREITRLGVNLAILSSAEITSPSAIELLYANRETDSGESSAIRYAIIAGYLEGSYDPVFQPEGNIIKQN